LEDCSQILELLDEIQNKSKRKFLDQEILSRANVFWKRNQQKIISINNKKENPQRLQAKQVPSD
jgi:hypothetical protein